MGGPGSGRHKEGGGFARSLGYSKGFLKTGVRTSEKMLTSNPIKSQRELLNRIPKGGITIFGRHLSAASLKVTVKRMVPK